METTIADRFKILIKELKMTNNSFAISIGKTSSTINYIVDGKSKPGYELLEAVFKAYPQISRDWLLMGEGTIFKNLKNETSADNYLQDHLKKLEKQFSEMAEMFRNQISVKDTQLSAKDKQIEQLLSLLGKLECVTGTGVIKHPAVVGVFLETLGQRA